MTTPSHSHGVVTLAAAFGIVALTVYFLVVGEAILMPLVLAVFIAYLIAAMGHRIERLKVGGRHPPSWLGLAAAVLIFLLVIALTVQITAGNVRAVVEAAPRYQEGLQDMFTQGTALAARLLRLEEPPTLATLAQGIDLSAVVQRFAGAFQSIAANTFQVFAYVVFLLLEMRTFDRKLKAVFPDPAGEHLARATLTTMGEKIETYVLIKTGISLLNGVLSYIVLKLFGVDFAGFWALLVFVLNFIPYIGSPLAMLFPTVLALLQFPSPVTAVFVLASLIGLQAFVENVIEPQITGRSLNLSPVVMILSLSVWGAIWGITGMILSVPLMVIAMIVLAQFPKTRPVAVIMSASGDVT
ncbi:MAG: AI-2E family transporter [Rhodospirillaceae bacterium]|nr:AI-2E family transporter [Rhodospirillaceae bacterium]